MKPYYEHDGITIYHGDNREILPALPDVDVVLTDPPWPMESSYHYPMEGSDRAADLWAEVAPLLKAQRLLVWHAINNDPRVFLDPLVGWRYLRLVYIRRAIPGHFGRVLMDGEAIHALGTWPKQRKGRKVVPGGYSINFQKSDRTYEHPGPRSLRACRWLLNWWSDSGDTVLDPFLGSGTTLVAAKHLGRRGIGIEIEEKYCELSARQLAQEVLIGDDLDPSDSDPTQHILGGEEFEWGE